jgi:hypothetical protein
VASVAAYPLSSIAVHHISAQARWKSSRSLANAVDEETQGGELHQGSSGRLRRRLTPSPPKPRSGDEAGGAGSLRGSSNLFQGGQRGLCGTISCWARANTPATWLAIRRGPHDRGLKVLAGTKAAYAPKVEFIFLNGNLMERLGRPPYLSPVANQIACPKGA